MFCSQNTNISSLFECKYSLPQTKEESSPQIFTMFLNALIVVTIICFILTVISFTGIYSEFPKWKFIYFEEKLFDEIIFSILILSQYKDHGMQV
jgi:hypothetical protein